MVITVAAWVRLKVVGGMGDLLGSFPESVRVRTKHAEKSCGGACCRANSRNSELGRRAAKLLIELDPRNAVNYVFLSNMHAAGGKWEDVAEAR
ncbi:hypothetical protein Fmac_018399 [Flemingia macrophylla]|uniref:Uncharacterized protein n=1 Tax=Flemingia macrophylla TaxID=520843 RepID=A0ABD1M4V4_9FABA